MKHKTVVGGLVLAGLTLLLSGAHSAYHFAETEHH
jgi:hypothetical protein